MIATTTSRRMINAEIAPSGLPRAVLASLRNPSERPRSCCARSGSAETGNAATLWGRSCAMLSSRHPRTGRYGIRAGAARSGVADEWVEVAVGEIDDQVDQQEAHREDQHDPLQHRIVALRDRVEGVETKTRKAEDRLDDHRAAENQPELDAEQRHHRDQRIAQRMARHDREFAQPLRLRRADVVLA